MTIGEMIFPKNIPNLNHKQFNGFNIFEFNNPKIKNINEIIKDQYRGTSPLINGQSPISKNTVKNIIPKLRLVGIFNSFTIN